VESSSVESSSVESSSVESSSVESSSVDTAGIFNTNASANPATDGWGLVVLSLDTIGNVVDYSWVLDTNPFYDDDSSNCPWVDLEKGTDVWLSITQRQLAWIVAKHLVNDKDNDGGWGVINDATGTPVLDASGIPVTNGLQQVFDDCGDADFKTALGHMLNVLESELDGGDGKTITFYRPNLDDASSSVVDASGVFETPQICYYDVSSGTGPTMDDEKCNKDEGIDFMSGVAGQMLIDIAGGSIGGGGMCNLQNSQDESLVIMYPEVLAMSFFCSKKQLSEPGVFFGVRRYVDTITGATNNGVCGTMGGQNTDMLTEVITLDDGSVYYKTAFGAIQSVKAQSACCTSGDLTPCVTNKSGRGDACFLPNYHKFRQFVDSTSYGDFEKLFSACVESIGTGPWGAGVWWGNSEVFFLAVWAACSAQNITLDYYVYNVFCENYGNQCYLLGEDCSGCLSNIGVGLGNESGKTLSSSACGAASLAQVIAKFSGKSLSTATLPSEETWSTNASVFDYLMDNISF